jgi:hypothetical protein
MSNFPELPTFLDRKANPIVPGEVKHERPRGPRISEEESLIQGAWADAEKDAIRERFAARRLVEKEVRAAEKRLVKNGAEIYLNAKLENCPLNTGKHTVELVKLGRKWVSFRVVGRKNCVKTRRVIWDAILVK